MKISINNGDSAVYTGFGHATFKIMSNVPKTKHSLLLNRPAPFEFTFGHAGHYIWHSESSYKIGYSAWESTEVLDGWEVGLSQINELWVPNKFCKDVFTSKVDVPIIVFPHGIDETFRIKRRVPDGTLKFLHIGYPAYRKNLHDTVEAFLELYKGRKDVTLTIKTYQNAKIYGIDEPNIKIINETTSYSQLVDLMHEHDVLVYPSWGEGFGLIPLQALATGMPAIVTDGWADYDYYAKDLVIESKLSMSPWQNVHPGKMFKPSFEDLKAKMLYCEENLEMLLDRHYEIAPQIHEEWAWEKVVREHFDSVEARLMV